MPAQKLKDFLDQQHIPYESIPHSKVFTAVETAQSAHVPGKIVAKTVIIRVEGKLAMAVLPADHRLDFNLLRNVTGSTDPGMTTEKEFRDRFPDCEIGGMPPFGNLYGMHVFVESGLADNEQIAFNAGTHTELIKMAYKDFASLVHPRVMAFAA